MDVDALLQKADTLWKGMQEPEGPEHEPVEDDMSLDEERTETQQDTEEESTEESNTADDSPEEESLVPESEPDGSDADVDPQDDPDHKMIAQQEDSLEESPFEYQPEDEEDSVVEPTPNVATENDQDVDTRTSQSESEPDVISATPSEDHDRQFDQESFSVWEPDYSDNEDAVPERTSSESNMLPGSEGVSDERGLSQNKPGNGQLQVSLPDGWQSEISQVVQQQMRETQELIKSHLDDELSRSMFHVNVLGGY